ncbi:hypothetical protein [Nostoc sp. S13]|uniref:hypothetical protein n=1 Tax=Nostoc sp. S13 TaxID=3019266 RepID=UPI002605FB39|nr:hypothetical protein [Nostoc sp. S13]MDF5739828.1 hypothetical protein [Nostoc sp. S13]
MKWNETALPFLRGLGDLLCVSPIADKESGDATQELLDIPGFIESFEWDKKDVAEGRIKSWRTRSDV